MTLTQAPSLTAPPTPPTPPTPELTPASTTPTTGPATVPVPAAVRRAAQRVEDRLGRYLAEQYARWSTIDPDLAAPVEALSDAVFAGGKRLRPAFCLLGFEAAGGDPDLDPARRQLDDAGAALELLHAFALVHDDVMDGSVTRRGRATTHVRFGFQHQLLRGRGESRRFGESAAILVGDLAHVFAEQLAERLPTAAQAL
jgi:geranylgeranyl diphosphate synthase type I